MSLKMPFQLFHNNVFHRKNRFSFLSHLIIMLNVVMLPWITAISQQQFTQSGAEWKKITENNEREKRRKELTKKILFSLLISLLREHTFMCGILAYFYFQKPTALTHSYSLIFRWNSPHSLLIFHSRNELNEPFLVTVCLHTQNSTPFFYNQF